MIARLRTVLAVLLSDAAGHRLQSLAGLAGVAVGVAVVVAIRLASQAALDQFSATVTAFSGVATHQLVGSGPLPAERLPSLLADPAVEAAHPVVATTLVVPPDASPDERPRSLRLVGVDPFLAADFLVLDPAALASADTGEAGGDLFTRLLLEPGLVAMGRAALDDLGLADGDRLTVLVPGGRRQLTVAAVDDPRLSRANPPVALADLATAQETLDLGAEVLRFDLILAGGEDGEGSWAAPTLAPGERLERPDQRGERADSMTSAFRMNLLCLGFLAVLVGAFVAYNMAQFAVTRRRALLGRLRCLGCSSRDLLLGVLLEAGLSGLLASLAGVALGRGLAVALVDDVATTVSVLYGPVAGDPVPALDGATTLVALALGTVATLAATWGPARAAARTAPIAVAGQLARDPLPAPALAVGLAVLAALSLLPPDSPVLLPALSVLSLLLAVACALPHLLGRLVARTWTGTVVGLAAGRLGASLGRTGTAAGALSMPVAMTLAIVVMVGSFRGEVSRWSQAVLGADLYMSPRFAELSPGTLSLDEDWLAGLGELPGVEAVDRLRMVELPLGDSTLLVGGTHLESVRRRDSLRILDGPPLDQTLAALDRGQVLVSEPLSRRLALAPGDSLDLPGPEGPEPRTVAAVFQDFSFDRGYALLDEARFVERFGPVPVRSAALILEPGPDGDTAVRAEALAAELAAAHPDVDVRSVAHLREDVIVAFDRTFAITYVLQAVSTGLALLGILTALLCLHLERRQELGVLRALGARQGFVARLLVTEATALMGLALAAAVPTGLVLAWILVAIVNTRSFGWSFPLRIEPDALGGVLLLALAAGLVAGAIPWLLARRARVAALLEVRS